uniref:EcxA zinc-binding domain-containing protein n=1 Tax=viral metagenome TaxID=1070528 RepID=A0A6C0BKI8_9ZZZZ
MASVSGQVDQNHVLINWSDVKDRTYIVAFGVSRIQGYDPVQFYLHPVGDVNFTATFQDDPNDSSRCMVALQENPHVWSGVPIRLPLKGVIAIQVDLTEWLSTYSAPTLQSAYQMLGDEVSSRHIHSRALIGGKTADDADTDTDEETPIQIPTGTNDNETELVSVETIFQQVDTLPIQHSFRVKCQAKTISLASPSDQSVEYVINFYPQPETPMIGRVGDSRVGYFYDNLKIETSAAGSRLTGHPITLIDRKNLDRIPWTYILDASIPSQYQTAVKSGIESWNRYFQALHLGQPLKVIKVGDPDYPQQIDFFDMQAWYVVGTNVKNFNGPYSGYSMCTYDYRSGEDLFGLISLNLTKIISMPQRYAVMGTETPPSESLERQVEQYVSWVTAHEMGHQLGLRHNFMGSFGKDHVSTVMDYVDVFNELISPTIYNPWGTIREYDLIAIEYGYTRLPDEQTGVKHPHLNQILDRLRIPFGTDENYLEQINPLVNATEDLNDPLEFVQHVLPLYRTYRRNLVTKVQAKEITAYEYNNMFTYLYTQKYVDLADICLRYIGGRYYDATRTSFLPIQANSVTLAVNLLLTLLQEIEYTQQEYANFIYDYEYHDDRQVFNRIQMESIYSFNTYNLYYFYQGIVTHIMKSLVSKDHLIRLAQNIPIDVSGTPDVPYMTSTGVSPVDLLMMFTFDVSQGIFSSIGQRQNRDNRWQTTVLTYTPLQHNRQYLWVDRLVRTEQSTHLYPVKEAVDTVLRELETQIQRHVLPYIQSLKHFRLHEHWSLLLRLIQKVTTK